jgi:hypothetical protein
MVSLKEIREHNRKKESSGPNQSEGGALPIAIPHTMKESAKAEVESTLMSQAQKGNLQWAIREHDAIKHGPHLDLAIGSPKYTEVADFVIQNGIASLTDLIGALSTGQVLSVFPMELHSTNPYLTKPIGYGKVEPPGYGAGPWKMVDKGMVIPKGNHRSFFLQGLGAQFFHMSQYHWRLKII